MLNKINNMLKKLSKLQKVILAFAIGYFIYITYVKVERFFNEEGEEVEVEDEDIQTGMFDIFAQNLGLETDNTLAQERQDLAQEDEYRKYEGDDLNSRKAFAIADNYKKY